MRRLALVFILIATPAIAEPPRIVADIPPVHSLVAQVMEGVGDPVLLLDGVASPHGGSLRPSQARALAKADLVVWIGNALTPWLGKAIRGDSLPLLDVEKTHRLHLREDHDHDHDGPIDPHAWLDPENARLWLGIVADSLARHDPANANIYAANAAAAQARLAILQTLLADRLAPLKAKHFAVAHDAFHYFENRFGLKAIAALSAADGDRPGPGRLRKLRKALLEGGAVCLFAEPDGNMPERLTSGTNVRIARLDPLGTRLDPGMMLYAMLLEDMTNTIVECLKPQ